MSKVEKGKKILVFAGTFEGHGLAKFFAEKGWLSEADFSVATDYGTETLSDIEGISVLEGRMSPGDMEDRLQKGAYAMVIDATHPYAKEVTRNIKGAAEKAEIPYIRLLRETGTEALEGIDTVESAEEAAAFLKGTEGKILLTTGSKELHWYKDLAGRVIARVLPSEESLRLCAQSGISPKQIICMQGPFTKEMNLATIRQYGCSWLVTKDTGNPGGFADKIACREDGCRILVIRQPEKEQGYSLAEVKERAEAFYER